MAVTGEDEGERIQSMADSLGQVVDSLAKEIELTEGDILQLLPLLKEFLSVKEKFARVEILAEEYDRKNSLTKEAGEPRTIEQRIKNLEMRMAKQAEWDTSMLDFIKNMNQRIIEAFEGLDKQNNDLFERLEQIETQIEENIRARLKMLELFENLDQRIKLLHGR